LGQDPAILLALIANVLSWLVRTLTPSLLPRLLPKCAQEEDDPERSGGRLRTQCVSIGRPGGVEQLRIVALKPGIVTCGYNVEGQNIPFSVPLVQDEDIPKDCVVLCNDSFSVNYADCCIRWGLYESAKQYVGYPIVPGFDVAGTVEKIGRNVTEFQPGDKVFGCSLFGAYSSKVLVPEIQLRKVVNGMSFSEAASLPAVSLTALYALHLAGHFPNSSGLRNKAILIHSAAGGVGSMLVQMSKLLGLSPVVGVVGQSSKVDEAKRLGCDYVIDKGSQNLWSEAEKVSPAGYSTIMDSNGVSTLSQSYAHLAMTGRLIVFGFHTNLPMGKDALSPLEWLRMARKMRVMPTFDPMEMGASNRSVLAFNLSFFADEDAMVSELFDQVWKWLDEGALKCPRVVVMAMTQVDEAHDLIQSGASIGKIVLKTS
jgi:NADPH:quinone reductase-like Zn-dependent oxidoreductase